MNRQKEKRKGRAAAGLAVFALLLGLLVPAASALTGYTARVVITYLSEDGTVLGTFEEDCGADAVSRERYEHRVPEIEGYILSDPNQEVIRGTDLSWDYPPSQYVRHATGTATVVYARAGTVRVSYRYADGTQASPDVTRTGRLGQEYEIPSPTVAYYTPDEGTVRGVFRESVRETAVIYTRNVCRVRYEGAGGVGIPQGLERYAGLSYTIPDTVPTLGGYVFDSWEDGTGRTYRPGQTVTLETDLTLLANWREVRYTLTFHPAGGSGEPGPMSKRAGISLVIPEQVPVRPGYRFLGWADARTRTEPGYLPGEYFREDRDRTLYALWAEVPAGRTYRVLYDANGGTGAPLEQTKRRGVGLLLSGTRPEKPHASFLGWNTSLDGTGISYAPGDVYREEEDLTLYALWLDEEYELGFDASPGGPTPEALRGPFDCMVSIPPIRPALSGSVFLGWRSGSGRLYDAGEEYTLRFSETLVAAWAPDEADLLVRDLVLDPGTLKPGQEGRATFVLLGTNRINPYADVPVAILFDGEELGRVRATPEPGVPLTLSVPFCPGQVLPGEHRFCVTADPDGSLRDDDRSNNSAQTVLTIEPLHETRLSWVACPGEILPGRSFYVSCMLYNEGTPDILPTDGERLEMVLGTASDGAVLEVQRSAGAAVPSGGSNFYWFLLRCPEDMTPGAGLYVRLSFRFGDEREENPGNQRLLSVVRVRGETGWQAGREGYFAHPPASYSGIPTPRVEPFYTSSRWTVWEWDTDRGFFPVTFGVNFVLYSFFTDLQGRARKEFASGEGFGLKVILSPCGLQGAVYDWAFLQGPCEMCLTYPEHGYAGEDGKSDSLVPVSGSWFLPGNVHFIPLYLPDGPYRILLTLSGLSSPLGMLGGTVRLPGLTLKGSLYDRYTFGSTSA